MGRLWWDYGVVPLFLPRLQQEQLAAGRAGPVLFPALLSLRLDEVQATPAAASPGGVTELVFIGRNATRG